MTSGDDGGLRERKKNRTREEIQRRAVELFLDRGYSATTVEQIAAAADVSPRTVYRYYPTKDALVVTDEYDDALVEAYARQPAGLPPLEAFRAAFAEVFGAVPREEVATHLGRRDLIVAEPELQAALLRTLVGVGRRFVEIEIGRSGRPEDRRELTYLVGAVIGVALVGAVATDPPAFDPTDLTWVDEALAALEHGFGGARARRTEAPAG